MSEQDYHKAIVESAKEAIAEGGTILRLGAALNRQATMTKQQMLDRVSLLSSEIDANEDENRVMQEEINDLYKKIDSLG